MVKDDLEQRKLKASWKLPKLESNVEPKLSVITLNGNPSPDLLRYGGRRLSMEKYTHPMLTHRNGDNCVWIEGTGWFVPLDAGGEGSLCENKEHLEFQEPQGKWVNLVGEGLGPVTRYESPKRKSSITIPKAICVACEQRQHDECTGWAKSVTCLCATMKHVVLFRRR